MTRFMSKEPSLCIQSRTDVHNRSADLGSRRSAGQSAVPGMSAITDAQPRAVNSSERVVLSGLLSVSQEAKGTKGLEDQDLKLQDSPVSVQAAHEQKRWTRVFIRCTFG